ncbi:transglycosylase SLT domain-containing protein [Actinacidiphila sp. ITFR-21]|uniref:transglycosylase SLT domain-containing protein n=1 Tax=Actinacidiphila sp. ITFR-21 TaxID=3075199 RepID=UPI002889549D|nr:transglycosylase SLT domain-containing protein [Streptomyces sp. ITFR-21]WNI17437.1 transglycosylase SLT domain-containing protein [Streptomyces sp. ITFR-21]
MQLPTIPNKLPTFSRFNRLSKKHKMTAAGATAATALVLTVAGLEATAGAGSATAAGDPTGFAVSTGEHVKSIDVATGVASPRVVHDFAQPKQDAADATHKKAAAGDTADKKAAAAKKKAAERKAEAAASERAREKAAANRSTKRTAVVRHAAKAEALAPRAAAKSYSNNLDGWIRQSLDIMHSKGIPGSYSGIHRNIMRESSGNPQAINLWDINAKNGIPSKGLLQVINPTFDRYHVAGTSWNIYNPVANITAACNYAADRYGSMDNVNSAY